MRVLMVTNGWPTLEHPEWVPFIVQQVDFLRRAGVEVEVFSFYGRKSPAEYLKAWRRLRQAYNLYQFEIVHAQFGQSGLVALPSPIPLVTTFHGSDLQGYVNKHGQFTLLGRVLQLASRWVARRSNEVVLVAEHLAAYLPAGINYQVIPCGIDTELFKPMSQRHAREQLHLPQNKKLVLFAADQGKPVKRYHLARAVVDHLTTDYDVDLLVVSDKSHEEMPLYMNACDALLLTSKHEGSPTVIKEALACNLPIVATDVGDVRSRIGHVEGCAVCPQDDPAAISYELQIILQKSGRIDGQPAIADLSEDKLVLKLITVYRSAMNHAA
jgi:glycosyltransferase involved in cell wall biosynthesis